MRNKVAAVVAMVLVGCGAPTSLEAAGITTDAGSVLDGGNVADAGAAATALVVTAEWQAGPMKRLGNQLTVRVVDDVARTVEGATVEVALFMPAHGHGAPAPAVTAQGNGLYDAAAVNFTMAGSWRVTVSAQKSGLSSTQVLTVVVP